ncbi:MAG: methyltransferase domain-containing protein [Methanomassiliicoccales archaeon]|nr:methyltransferase domain-containing protein [Methanomassiliicoccales archaeon]
MVLKKVLFELSGEHPSLPRAEVLACLEAESPEYHGLRIGPGYLIADCELGSLDRLTFRLALTHRLGPYLGNASLDDLERQAAELPLPPGSLSVRARSVQGLHPEVNTMDLAKRVGHTLRGEHRIDLDSPDMHLRMLLSDEVHFFLRSHEVDRKQFDRRKVAERPYFSPVSLHPRYARALVNLTGARKGDVVLDPFCGTGGIVLEAALLGMRALGSDVDPAMVEGCRRNLEHFGADGVRLEVCDVGDIGQVFGEVKAVATDPPYGRAASTKKEAVDGLYGRGLEAMAGTVCTDGRIGVVLPRQFESPSLELLQLHRQRVHRSLTRHYHLFRPRAP